MKRRMTELVLGVIFLAVGLAVGWFGPRSVAWEREPLQTWPVARSQQALPRVGQGVVLVGQLDPQAPKLVRGLALAMRERFNTKDRSWTSTDPFTQPLDLLLADGGRVRVEEAGALCRGNVSIEQGDGERWVGLRGGEAWTVLATVLDTDPPRVQASYHYAGPPEEYEGMLRASLPIILGFSALFSLVGLGLTASVAWSAWRG
jgi:hypothetical protein